jgi:hypothetical protein
METLLTGSTTLARIWTVLKRTTLTSLLLWLALTGLGGMGGGCTTIRITDPDHTADELYLENVASKLAVDQVSVTVLRDRRVYIDSTYLTASTQPSDQQQYLIGELRAKLLLAGVRLASQRKDAEIIMELRSQGTSVNHLEFLLGIPASSVGGIFTGGIAAQTPELSIVKRTQQHGYSSVAFIAYWADTGEVVAASGPFVGRTLRDDYWFFGVGPQTIGNVPPAEPAPVEGGNIPEDTGKNTGKKKATPATKPAPPPPHPRMPVESSGKP